jgi:hypothetical protein
VTGLNCELQTPKARNGNELIREIHIIKVEIVTSGDKVTKKSLEDLKERLKESPRQVDILITTHCIQVI